MLVALNGIEHGTSELLAQTVEELDKIAPLLISGLVITLNAWTKSRLQNHVGDFEAANSNVVPFRTT